MLIVATKDRRYQPVFGMETLRYIFIKESAHVVVSYLKADSCNSEMFSTKKGATPTVER